MGSLWIYVIAVLTGIALGYALPVFRYTEKICTNIADIGLWLTILIMGFNLGADQDLFSYLPIVGLQAVILTFGVIAGSVAAIWLFQKLLSRRKINVYHRSDATKDDSKKSNRWYTIVLLILIVVGIAAARLMIYLEAKQLIDWFKVNLSRIITVLLTMVIFVSGFNTGQRKDVVKDIRRSGWGMLITPMGVMIGSVAASLLIGIPMGLRMPESAVVGGACGWYSLVGAQLSPIDPRLAALAFLTNMMREFFGILLIPFINKHWGPLAAISPVGAAAMDTSLPAIVRCIGSDNAIIAFATGVVLTICVPILLGFLMPLLG